MIQNIKFVNKKMRRKITALTGTKNGLFSKFFFIIFIKIIKYDPKVDVRQGTMKKKLNRLQVVC